jgi:hypothetical protein
MHQAITESNWSLHARITESAGLAIYLASFRGRRVLWEASLPYITIDHQAPEAPVEAADGEDEDAEPPTSHGSFWLPLGQRTLRGEVRHERFRGGFELAADFAAGPYAYTQLWRFHADGRFAAWLTIHPGGLHDAHTYHPHWRIDLDIESADSDAFELAESDAWRRATREGWFPAGTSGKTRFRQLDLQSGRAIHLEPHRWDDADLFALRYREGETPPITPHSAVGDQPFPAGYPGDASIEDCDVTLWYVAHVHYRSSFPYTAGPLLRAVGF